MSDAPHILLLAGSAEARDLGAALDRLGHGFRVLMSEPARGEPPFSRPPDYRDFSGVNDMVLYLQETRARAILDASHGFDGELTDQASHAARALGLPYLRLERPPWDVTEHPRWRAARSVAAAMPMIAPGARVFSATGWASLPDYARFPGDVLLLRQTRQHRRKPPFPFVEPVFGLPPFTKASETQLFEEMGVDLLICRNIGGLPSRPKLEAAKALGLDVILVDRPVPPPGLSQVETVEAALDWVASL